MDTQEIRRRFIQHFKDRDHLVVDSASLVPVDDPTTLFISAGMQPLQPYFRGIQQPPAARLVSCQKCFRTGDLDEVGRTDRHHTFFEMLGNFAPTGGYFKRQAIPWAWELVTDPAHGYGMPRDRLRVTVHPSDDEARDIWRRETDVEPGWVYDSAENWWELASGLGPCGPDSELWWDRGPAHGCGRPDCYPDHCDRFLEFWNLVFPSYDKQPDGSTPPLPRPGIDTGMGLERLASILQGGESNFDTDLFAALLHWVREAAANPRKVSERVVADHVRAMTFVIADGVEPSNEGRGYVLRRVIRRAALHARRMGMRRPLAEGVPIVVSEMSAQYPYLTGREAAVKAAVERETQAFERTLERGLERFERLAAAHADVIPGDQAFLLHDTFGIPLELTAELAQERGLTIDQAAFEAAMTAQRERSRRTVVHDWTDLAALPRSEFCGYERMDADALVLAIRREGRQVDGAREGDEVEVYVDRTPFYAESGGQIGDTGRLTGPQGEVVIEDARRPLDGVFAHLGRVRIGTISVGEQVRAAVDAGRRRQIMRHHTATHVLNKALEELLGQPNLQRGSWVGPDHTTFDFPFDRPLTADELERLSARINDQVRAALPLEVRVLPYDEAVATGATHLFDERYGDTVRVVCFGTWSCEFCGGTHSATTADVAPVLVLSESSIGQGLRRIDMVAGRAAEDMIRKQQSALQELSRELSVAPDHVPTRVAALQRELRDAKRQTDRLRDEVRQARVRGGGGEVHRRDARIPLVLEHVPADGMDDLRGYADRYLEAIGGSGVVGVANDVNFVIKISRNLADKYDATRLVRLVGRGGGRPELAQGRLGKPAEDALRDLEEAFR